MNDILILSDCTYVPYCNTNHEELSAIMKSRSSATRLLFLSRCVAGRRKAEL